MNEDTLVFSIIAFVILFFVGFLSGLPVVFGDRTTRLHVLGLIVGFPCTIIGGVLILILVVMRYTYDEYIAGTALCKWLNEPLKRK